ncbi:MAG TPA: hypothetical protein VFG04_26885 [Planctomycetaceae bacterium]|jgi:hypothetical protein|nr:hypothetical protein [Planctomycetaceae bacterium]
MRCANRRRSIFAAMVVFLAATAQPALRADGSGSGAVLKSVPSQIVATVLTADGHAAAKAKVAVGVAGSQILITNGEIDDWSNHCERMTTDDAGRMRFQSQTGDFWLVVTHPAGYRWLRCSIDSIPKLIRLTAWARAEGTLRVARKPQPNARILIEFDGKEVVSEKDPIIVTKHIQTTDTNGRFVFDRVVEGEGRIGTPFVQFEDRSAGTKSSARVATQFVSGKTTKIELGTSGRPVIGQLRWSPKLKLDFSRNPVLLEVRQDNRRPGATVFTATVDDQGNFCVGDMPIGEYVLTAHAHTPVFVGDSHRFHVPAIDAKLSQRPVDLGVLVLKDVVVPK